MTLDLSRLDEIALKAIRKDFRKPVEGETTHDVPRLQKEADNRKAEADRTLKIFKEYQSNIKTSSQLQDEILKGVMAGDGVYTLFLKAVKAISLMISNEHFFTQTKADMLAIYGTGLGEPEPLRMELEAVKGRLAKLRQAQERQTEPQDSRQRIAAAIKAHEYRAGVLKNNLIE